MKPEQGRPPQQGHSKSAVPCDRVVSSKSALDDYYDDILGSIVDDPLKKLEAAEKQSEFELKGHSQSSLNTSTKKRINEPRHSSPKRETANQAASAEQAKPNTIRMHEAAFAEPQLSAISSLIIPAAFPKLAPVTVQTKPKVQAKLKAETSVEAKINAPVASETKIKLDRKSALALLEAKKSRLTENQRIRLEHKLNHKSQTRVQQQLKQEVLVEKDVLIVEEKAVEVETVEENTQVNSVHIAEKINNYGPPDWGQERFECLIFSVAGLKLAVPLASLGAIYKIENELTPLVGRADWFMGLYRHLERNVSVFDTAKLVMPDRWNDSVQEGYQFIIRLGGNNWGMACDAVHESIQLMPDEVKWRTERSRRAWLSGTVIDHMCALLDVDALGDMLHRETGNEPRQFS